MVRRTLFILCLFFLACGPALAQDEEPAVGWGVRADTPAEMQSALLNCAPVAINRSARLSLQVIGIVDSRRDFIEKLKEQNLSRGLWVTLDTFSDKQLLSVTHIVVENARSTSMQSGLIDDGDNRPCDLAYRLTWELTEKPLDPAARKFIFQARQQWQAGRYLEADALYRKALIVSHHAYVACREAGRMWETAGRPDIAMGWYQLALDRNPYDYLTLTYMGRLYENQGYNRQALETYERALLYGPRLMSKMIALGRLYAKYGYPAEAQRILTEVVELDPENLTAITDLNRVAAFNEDWSMAAHTMQMLVDHGQDDDGNLRRLADYQWRSDDYAAAVDTLRLLVDRHPDDYEILRDYVTLNMELARYEKAERYLLIILQQNPDDLESLHELAQIYFQTRRFAEAVQVLQRAAALAPRNLGIRRMLSKAYELNGEYDQALAGYEEILRSRRDLTSDDLDRYVDLARRLNRLPQARNNLYQLMKRSRKGRTRQLIAWTVGRLEEEQGDLDAALRAYEQALPPSSIQPRLRFELGRLYLKKNDTQRAAYHFRHLDTPGVDARLLFAAARLTQRAGDSELSTDLFGAAYRNDSNMTVAGLLHAEGLMLRAKDYEVYKLLQQLDQQVVSDTEREQLLWLQLFFAAEFNMEEYYSKLRHFCLFFISRRPTTQVELAMWTPVVGERIAEPRQGELLDLLRVFARQMTVAEFEEKYQTSQSSQPSGPD